jgi:predicted CXXCH cytochrome family protein
MLRKIRTRMLIGLGFALILGCTGWVIDSKAKASPPIDQIPAQAGSSPLDGVTLAQVQSTLPDEMTPDCQGCHDIVREHWQAGAHGQAISDQTFQQAWAEQGSPLECMQCHTTGFDAATGTWDYDGVACVTCHNPVNENHPQEVMPTDISSRLCGECHLDTFAQWETSVHAQEDLACVSCHNAHTTDIKADDVQQLCSSCHSDAVHYFNFTPHAEAGLLCTDCHLRISGSEMGDGHGKRLHYFKVDIDTCVECHSDGLHSYTPAAMGQDENQTVSQSSMIPEIEQNLEAQPGPVSPVGFGILGTLVGLAFGMLLAPWLERWFKRFEMK